MARRIRILGLLVLLLVGTVTLIAAPPYEVYYDYYTDASFSDWCGYRYILCNGIYSSGCRTSYYTVEQGPEC